MDPNKQDGVVVETRLLRTISKLLETITISNAVAIGQFDPNLAGAVPSLIRFSLEELHERFMDGRFDLMQMTADELETIIAQVVSTTASKLLGTAPDGDATPQAPSLNDPRENPEGC